MIEIFPDVQKHKHWVASCGVRRSFYCSRKQFVSFKCVQESCESDCSSVGGFGVARGSCNFAGDSKARSRGCRGLSDLLENLPFATCSPWWSWVSKSLTKASDGPKFILDDLSFLGRLQLSRVRDIAPNSSPNQQFDHQPYNWKKVMSHQNIYRKPVMELVSLRRTVIWRIVGQDAPHNGCNEGRPHIIYIYR